MYFWCKRIRGSMVPLIGLFAWAGNSVPARADGATRELPLEYSPNVPFTVSITIEVPVDTDVVTLEDSPPDGWTNIDYIVPPEGTYDAENHKVKWWFSAPFPDPFVLTYDVTPPLGAVGVKCFTGDVSFDAVINEPIGGDQCIGGRIPAVTEWGLVVMVLLGLAVGTIMFRKGRAMAA